MNPIRSFPRAVMVVGLVHWISTFFLWSRQRVPFKRRYRIDEAEWNIIRMCQLFVSSLDSSVIPPSDKFVNRLTVAVAECVGWWQRVCGSVSKGDIVGSLIETEQCLPSKRDSWIIALLSQTVSFITNQLSTILTIVFFFSRDRKYQYRWILQAFVSHGSGAKTPDTGSCRRISVCGKLNFSFPVNI